MKIMHPSHQKSLSILSAEIARHNAIALILFIKNGSVSFILDQTRLFELFLYFLAKGR